MFLEVLRALSGARVLASLGAMAVLGALGLILWRRRKPPTPEELEKRRRLQVCRAGRVAEGLVTDIHGQAIDYVYTVGGMEYRSMQDLSHLTHLLPDGDQFLLGYVSLKYMAGNPANSIVVGEEWSGLRPHTPAAATKQQ
jgi:hypothetical protein